MDLLQKLDIAWSKLVSTPLTADSMEIHPLRGQMRRARQKPLRIFRVSAANSLKRSGGVEQGTPHLLQPVDPILSLALPVVPLARKHLQKSSSSFIVTILDFCFFQNCPIFLPLWPIQSKKPLSSLCDPIQSKPLHELPPVADRDNPEGSDRVWTSQRSPFLQPLCFSIQASCSGMAYSLLFCYLFW